jgi:hypothetical protein
MEENVKYEIGNYVFLNGFIKVIKHVNELYVTIDGKQYPTNVVKPITIEDTKNLIIRTNIVPMGSLFDNGNGQKTDKPMINPPKDGAFSKKAGLDDKDLKKCSNSAGEYWKIPEDMHNKNFFKEEHLKYVHELQHYLRNDSPGMLVFITENGYVILS